MSAINFRLDVKRVPDPAGDRVVGPLAHRTDLDPNLLNGRKDLVTAGIAAAVCRWNLFRKSLAQVGPE